MFGKKKKMPAPDYDPEREKPALRCSICTGERVAGFKELKSGRFREAALIRSDDELAAFMESLGISEIEKFY